MLLSHIILIAQNACYLIEIFSDLVVVVFFLVVFVGC